MRACAMGRYCQEHSCVHGSEAEELRTRMEALEAELDAADPYDGPLEGPDVARRLRRILDDVDARDSLAYLEISSEEEE